MCAQGPADGALRGRVVLPGGAPAAGAALSLGDADGKPVRTLILGRDGQFLFLRLAPGEYRVQASLPGFAALLSMPAAEVSLSGGDLAELQLAFRWRADLHSSAMSKTLSASPFALSTQTLASEGYPALSLQTDAGTLAALPLPSRNYQEAAALDSTAADGTPPTTPDTAASDNESEPEPDRAAAEPDTPGAGLSYGGLAITQNGFRQDGLSAEQGYRSGPRGAAVGGPRIAATFGEAAVRSFRVMPSTFSAQRGGAGGALFTVSSARAQDRLHGTIFAFVRESAWAAINPYSLVQHYNSGALSYALVRPADNEQQYGASVGLPLSVLHLGGPHGQHGTPALFASLEYQRRQAVAESSPSSPNFYALTPTQVGLLGTRGVTHAATAAALEYLDSLSGEIPRNDQRFLGFTRADSAFGVHDQIGAAFQQNQFTSPSGAQLSGPSTAVIARGRGSVGDTALTVTALSGYWQHTFRPGISHDVRGQWAHDLEFETPHLPLAEEPAISPGGFAPQVSIAPEGFSYGTPAVLGHYAYPDEHRVEVANSFLIAAGRHLLTFGGDWSRLDDYVASVNNVEGTFLYDSGATRNHAGGLVDWITDYTFGVNAYPNAGCPSIYAAVHFFCYRSYTQSFGGRSSHFVTHEIAAFFEDAMRPIHGFTVSLGVRSDYTLLPIPQNPNRKLDSIFATLAGAASGSTAVFPEDRNNFGPRFSLAWSPRSGRLFTMRAGYGVFFGRVPGATLQAALSNTALPATTFGVRLVPTTSAECPQIPNQGFGYPCAYISLPPLAVAETTAATEFSHTFRFPAVQRASFTMERALGRHLELSAAYQMATATQLPTSVDRNIAPASSTITYVLQGGDGFPGLRSGDTFVVPLYTERLSSQYGPVSVLLSSANATYHALTFESRVEAAGWLQLRGSFTFSRAIDYAPQLGASPRLNGRFDPYTPGYDKALSSLHFPARFAGNLILRSPVHGGSAKRRYLLGGWRMAAIATASSGAPYSYEVFGGTRLSGGHESLNGSGGAAYLPTVGRNTLRLPARGRVDLRLGRDFALHQRMRLEAFAQAFDLLNSRNIARVETRAFLIGTPASPGAPTPLTFQSAAAVASEGLSTPAFGQALSSTTGLSRERLLEMGVRLLF